MNTLKRLSLLALIICCTVLVKAQCGIQGGFYQNLNPNLVPWFHDTTTVNSGWQVTGRVWEFGDGTSSTLANPTHVFPHPGAYHVCLWLQAEDNNGNFCNDTVCKTVYINCDNMVQATISASVQNNIVVFTGTGSSNYPPLTYYWQFPGGTPSTSTTAVTTVSYNTTGAHQVYLTVTDSNGCSKTVTQSVTTTVANVCANVDANFSYTLAGQAGTTVYFNSTSTGTTTNTLYRWKIDGVFVTNANPNTGYVATNMGTFSLHEVCLYVYGNSNTLCDSICKTVEVTGCNVNVNAGFQSIANSNNVVFETGYSFPNQQTLWDFGDGTTSTDTAYRITHTYPASANTTTYNVCHYITINNTLCADTFCTAVVVPSTNTPCSMPAHFTYTLSGTTLSVNAGNNYPGGTWYQWSLDGQYTSTAPTYLAYTYNNLSAGQHRVCLYIKGAQGTVLCDSICQEITVAAVCGNVSFTSNNTYPTVLTATTTGTGTQYFTWKIKNANGITVLTGGGNPFTITSLNSGTYTACVFMYNSNQQFCDSNCHTIVVTNPTTCTASISDTTNPNGVHTLTAHYNGL
ncbi:MAG TPA: PKD domain-containing protein, partial [Chitinophagales bacterium]|nr:PKD domain-containing protein [Chitinophagales bacterium]